MILDQETRRFLTALHAGGAYGYWWTVEGRRSVWWEVGKMTPLPDGKRNIYFGVHPTTEIPATNARGEPKPSHEVRSQNALIAALGCLFVEYDAKDYDNDKDAAFHKVETLNPAPSAVVDSGGGYHCYWLLHEPFTLVSPDHREKARKLQAAWVRLMDGDPQSKDLARVLRVPGTLNHKYTPARPVAFVWPDTGARYAIDELAALAEPFVESDARQEAHAANGDHGPWLTAALAGEIAKVVSAPDGKKHDRLRDSAIALGGLVGQGLSEQAIEDGLYAAIEPRAADARGAHKTIQDGIAYGKARPRKGPQQQEPRQASNGTAPAVIPKHEFCTDLGNAQRLVAQHGADLRFVKEWGWLAWNGLHWELDQTGEIERRAKSTVLSIYTEAGDAPEHLRPILAKHAIASQAAARINAMIGLAESDLAIRMAAGDFDSLDWVLTCANGTLDLRTGEMRPANRDDFLTRAIEPPYQPDAACPTFLAFLDRIFAGDAPMIAYIQRVMGYALTGSTGGQCMFVLYGSGANGKSVLINTIRALLGSYTRNAAPETFLQQQMDRIRSDLARLAGCRVVSTVELDEGRRLSEALVKQMTGGDVITARFLNKNEFEFKPHFKVFMATNHKPIIRGTDYAIWRRIRLIPFAVTIPEAERDPLLIDRLIAELPGILAWSVQGCLEWQKNGLQEPDQVQAATSAYRSEMDLIGQFVDDMCVTAPNATVACAALYTAYSQWCDDGGERAVTQRRFGTQMTERGIDRTRGTGGTWMYQGIGLVTNRYPDPPAQKRSDVSDVSDVISQVPPREILYDEIYRKKGNLDHLDHYQEKSGEEGGEGSATGAPDPGDIYDGEWRPVVGTDDDAIARLKDAGFEFGADKAGHLFARFHPTVPADPPARLPAANGVPLDYVPSEAGRDLIARLSAAKDKRES